MEEKVGNQKSDTVISFMIVIRILVSYKLTIKTPKLESKQF